MNAAYLDKQSNTIMMTFDNKKMLGVDAKNYTLKSTSTLNTPGMKFTEFHGDPNNYVLIACENAKIIVYKPQRNMIMAQFDMEEAVKQNRIENGEELNEDE